MNKVYAIIGPPAAGKSAIAKDLLAHGVPEMISHTTRKPLAGEEHGQTYYFVDSQEFARIELIERIEYSNQFYGLSKLEVLDKINNFPISFVVVEAQGLEQLKKMLGQRVESIYLLVNEDIIIERMLLRGDHPDIITSRIEYAKAKGEFNTWKDADYVVKNTNSLEVAVRQILAILNLPVPLADAE